MLRKYMKRMMHDPSYLYYRKRFVVRHYMARRRLEIELWIL